MRLNHDPGVGTKPKSKNTSPFTLKDSLKSNKSNDKKKPGVIVQKKANKFKQIKEPGSHQEYFNFNKDKTPNNKIKCEISNDYSDSCRQNYGTIRKEQTDNDWVNKLKFNKPKTAIGFDGKAVTVEPRDRSNTQSRSSEQWTEILRKSEKSKSKVVSKKSKPKSKQKAKKSKSTGKLKDMNSNKGKEKQPDSGKEITILPFNTKINTSPPETEESNYISTITLSIDLDEIKLRVAQACERPKLVPNYLKKINKSLRSEWINTLSRICGDLKLSKQSFFLSIQLIDRYLNQQLVLSKHKILALASLGLSTKLDNQKMSRFLNQAICCKKQVKQMTESQKLIAIKTSVESQNPKSMNKLKHELQTKMFVYLEQLQAIIDQFIGCTPSPHEIFEFQTLILLKQDFRIPRNGITYWIDVVLMVWDNHLKSASITNDLQSNCLFMQHRNPFNYFCLSKMLTKCHHSLDYYLYFPHHIVLSSVFLICRINCESRNSSFDDYKQSLQKSNNLLFVDKSGVNAIFVEFLEKFDMQIGDMLSCCQFLSQFLENFSQKKSKLNQMIDREIFYRHIHDIS